MENIFSKTLVTGAHGMVGAYVDFGIKTSHKILDITNIDQVRGIVKKYQPMNILHLAAETDVDKCEREQEHAYFVNTIGTYNLLIIAKEMGIRFIYVSTAGVFDGGKETPYTEDDQPNPQNHYSRSKYLGEALVKKMLNQYLIVRPGWMFGGGEERDHKFVGKMIPLMVKKEINVVNDTIGSPTYAKDLIVGIKHLLKQKQTGIFHLANEGVCSRYDMAKVIAQEMRSRIKLIPVDSSKFNLTVKRIKSEAIISQKYNMRPWQDALREYIQKEWL